ncbi:hypothetical protein [Thermoactinospora rubra]|uniref:hypothetical protein n=1 Tax=Thermoactinospora rubra TaxID=1088767 RepID=UPI001301EE91|nr:hypothetical protein [Thermoactinospora rubra]
MTELFDLEAPEDLFETTRAATEPLEKMRAVRALAFLQHSAALSAAQTAPEDPDHPGCALLQDDVRYLEAFERALLDPVAGVRRAGLDALRHSLWPGARDIVRRHYDSLPQFADLIDEWLVDEAPRIRKPAS